MTLCRLRQDCMCWLSSPTSPTHSHPLEVWGQRTRTARTLRLWNLSNIVALCRLRQDCMCWLSSPTSPTHSHPLEVWGQRTRTARTLRLWNLSNIVARSGSLQMGHGFPSLFSLVAALGERWLPQQPVRWGSTRSSKVTGQKKSSDGCSTKSNSSGSEVVDSLGGAGGWGGVHGKRSASSTALLMSPCRIQCHSENHQW